MDEGIKKCFPEYLMMGYRFQMVRLVTSSICFSIPSSSCGKKFIPVLLSISSTGTAKLLSCEEDPEFESMNPITLGFDPPLKAIF